MLHFSTQKIFTFVFVKLHQQWNLWKVIWVVFFCFFSEVKKGSMPTFKHHYLPKVNPIHKIKSYRPKWCRRHDREHTLLHAVYTSFINREQRSKQRHKIHQVFLPSLVWNRCDPVRFKLDLRRRTKVLWPCKTLAGFTRKQKKHDEVPF